MKIKDIARITSNSPSGEIHTTVKYKTVKELGSSAPLRDLVLAAVYEYNEPMSVLEITSHINNTLGMEMDEPLIRYNLDALVKSGDVLTRMENPEERLLRGNGVKPTMNKLAKYFFRKGVGVPHRKTVELVPGVILKGPSSPRSARATKPITSKSFAEKGLDTSALDFLIEKIVAERTAELQRQLNEANEKLAQFKKLLS